MVRNSRKRRTSRSSTSSNQSSIGDDQNASALPLNLLIKIFTHIIEDCDDSESSLADLHSCLLVSRQWSNAAVQIFWSKPFHFVESAALIRLYLSFLHDDQQRKLSQGPTKNRMYDYPSLMKHLDYYAMLSSVKAWMTTTATPNAPLTHFTKFLNGGTSDGGHRSDILATVAIRALLKLFVNHKVQLDSLCIDTHSRGIYDIEHEDEFMLITQPEFASLTTNLSQFQIATGFNKGRLFRWMSRHCRQIEHLNVNMIRMRSYPSQLVWDENGNLAALISAQSSLVSLKLSGFDSETAEMDIIATALGTQSRTLRDVTFQDVDFLGCGPLDGLAECYQLRSLRFENVDNVRLDMIAPLTNAPLESLREVVAFGGVSYELQQWADSFYHEAKRFSLDDWFGGDNTSASGEDAGGKAKKRKKSKKKKNKKNKKTKNIENIENVPPPVIPTISLKV